MTARGCPGWSGGGGAVPALGIQADPVLENVRLGGRSLQLAAWRASNVHPAASLRSRRFVCVATEGRWPGLRLLVSLSRRPQAEGPEGRGLGPRGVGLSVCCKQKHFLAFRFISLKPGTLLCEVQGTGA